MQQLQNRMLTQMSLDDRQEAGRNQDAHRTNVTSKGDQLASRHADSSAFTSVKGRDAPRGQYQNAGTVAMQGTEGVRGGAHTTRQSLERTERENSNFSMAAGATDQLQMNLGNAFGNALGASIAGQTGRGSQQTEVLYSAEEQAQDFTREKNRFASAAADQARAQNQAAGTSAMFNGLGYAIEGSEPQLVKTAQAGGHFYLLALIANAAGISDERLSRIITFSQFPDQISATDGFTNGTRNIIEGNGYEPAATGLLSQRALHALNGMTMQRNLDFYQTVIAENRDNDAVAGIALHGLVDSVFHSCKDESGEYRTYSAPLGHGAHGSEPDFISPDQARAATGQIMAAFETISGKQLSGEQRTSVYNALNTALDRAATRTAQEVDQFNRLGEMYGPGAAGPYINPDERTELNFRNVVKEMVPNIPGVKLDDLPSPFFRGPITEQGTLAEGRTFFSNLPPAQADALTNQGMEAATRIMERYKQEFGDQTVPHTVQPGDLYDSKVWSLRKAIPWLNQMPQKVPAIGT